MILRIKFEIDTRSRRDSWGYVPDEIERKIINGRSKTPPSSVSTFF